MRIQRYDTLKVSVVFPSVICREGPEGIRKLIKGIEDLGYDELDMFDHVAMGYPTATRRAPFYTPQMPIMKAFMMLSFAAVITDRIGLCTGILVLPQREPNTGRKTSQHTRHLVSWSGQIRQFVYYVPTSRTNM
ncbi:MAG: hypothetical protein ACJAVI_003867 [Candidatus Azotimanducaceae bacterium]|jgi:hypothetical protein